MQIFAVEGNQMLIQASGTVSIPGIDLQGNAQMNEPIHLDGLPEGFWFFCRHNLTVFRDLQQFFFAFGIFFPFCKFSGIVAVTSAERDDRFCGHAHTF